MIPVNNLKGIIEQESFHDDSHIIILLLAKPSDENGQEIINKFNYLHQRAGRYCNIYPIGYSSCFNVDYKDIVSVKGVDNEPWFYSDKCFCEFTDDISLRLQSWRYRGDVQLVLLQNNVDGKKDKINFQKYISIDIKYGIDHGYIDSFSRFIERLIDASKTEVTIKEAINKANNKRFSCNSIICSAIEMLPKLPKPIKKIMADKIFFTNKA